MSTTTAALRIGSIWRKGAREAMVVDIQERHVETRAIVDGKLGRRSWPEIQRGQVRGYTFVGQQPTLRCVTADAVEQAIRHLRARNVGEQSAFACGLDIVVAMEPPSVIAFAETAQQRGWAHDEDCARMIGDLG